MTSIKRTLVIGGSGLISTALTRQLLNRGDEVTLFNRGRTPVRFSGEPKLIIGDRKNHVLFEEAIRKSGPWDCIIDMICSEPGDAESLLRAARGLTGQVIFCSTTNVYPKPADSYPVKPDHRLGAAYKNGLDKTACEKIHREAALRGDYKLTLIRPGHSYGEGGDIVNSIKNASGYMDRVRRGKPVIVHGDGNGLWSSLHVEDVAAVFTAASGNATAFGKTYNAAGSEWFTWNQYHAVIAKAMGVDCPPLVHIPIEVLMKLSPERAEHCARSLQYPGIYDMSDAYADLGVEQTIPLIEGMARTLRWIEENRGVEPCEKDSDYDRIIEDWESMKNWKRGVMKFTEEEG
ncbi:MAG: NAD-dependent epimerase/dehydratase family protein [Planctomycetes bacterium]|nr:NAD-dependent epimerase/dehydratase family protein [Planctomycetota bacterium]